MSKAKKPEVIRERIPVINPEPDQYEIRADYGTYGIAHYPAEKAKTKKSIMKKFDELLRNSSGKWVVVKPIALGESKVVIKDYDKLPQRHYAVFSQKRESEQYHVITFGVDRRDALDKITNLFTSPLWLSRKEISLLFVENNKIKKDKFAHLKVEDLTLTNGSVFTPIKKPYARIRGNPLEIKEKEPLVIEAELY